MAAVRLHNALFTPTPPMSFGSRSSITNSAVTSSDMLSSRQFERKKAVPEEPRLQRFSRIRSYALLGLSCALLVWEVYCSVRYFVALRIYGTDIVRSRYAVAMGTTSTFTFLVLATNSLSALYFHNIHFRRGLMFLLHSLTYFSSALVMSLAIINLTLVLVWKVPHGPADSTRSVQGRCNWDLDVVWSGTGGACSAATAMPFGDWLGAAIARLIITAVVLVAYHLAVHSHLAAVHSQESFPPMIFARDVEDGNVTVRLDTADDLRAFRGSVERHTGESSRGNIVPINRDPVYDDDEPPPRALSFTVAGQVLSRIEGSEADIGEEDLAESSASDSTHDLDHMDDRPSPHHVSLRSESPEPLPQPSNANRHPYASADPLPSNPPPSSWHRPIVSSSNDLQDFASAFRSLVSRISRDTQEGMTLDSIPERPPSRNENRGVQFLGSYISRMSTIESIASREVPSRSDTGHSPTASHPPSRNLSRNTTLTRGRERDGESESAGPSRSISPET